MTRRHAAVALATALSAVTLAACGREADMSSPPPVRALHTAASLPRSVLGLRVHEEKIVDKVRSIPDSYVAGLSLVTFRGKDGQLQATLQATRLSDTARVTDELRESIALQMGSTTPRRTRLEETAVWRASSGRQALALWFHGRNMYLLTVRGGFSRVRALVHELVEATA